MPNPTGRPARPPASREFPRLLTFESLRGPSDLAAAPVCAILWTRLGGFRLGMGGNRPNHRITSRHRACGLATLAMMAVFALAPEPARAHHSGAMFDMAHQITLTGVVAKVEWTNPHAFMYLEVKSDKGVAEEWAVEINSPNFLRHNGWTSSTVSPGDTITVTGAPAKTGARFMHGMLVELSSGVQLRS